ncbi:MAG: hypothetical protein MUC63_01910, partial [Planctomycetes bacterium]|nr:hypothetical protein [Planctomycetota bacterium]
MDSPGPEPAPFSLRRPSRFRFCAFLGLSLLALAGGFWITKPFWFPWIEDWTEQGTDGDDFLFFPPPYIVRYEAWTSDPRAISGRRMHVDPGHFTYPVFDAWENRLHEEIGSLDGPEEIFASIAAGYWSRPEAVIVRRKGGRFRLAVHEVEGRRKERDLEPEEAAALLSFLKDHLVDDLAPFESDVRDGLQVECVHLTPRGGRRV